MPKGVGDDTGLTCSVVDFDSGCFDYYCFCTLYPPPKAEGFGARAAFSSYRLKKDCIYRGGTGDFLVSSLAFYGRVGDGADDGAVVVDLPKQEGIKV